jgi:hypothetical protein
LTHSVALILTQKPFSPLKQKLIFVMQKSVLQTKSEAASMIAIRFNVRGVKRYSLCPDVKKRENVATKHTQEYDCCITAEVKGAEKFKWCEIFQFHETYNPVPGRTWSKKVPNKIRFFCNVCKKGV